MKLIEKKFRLILPMLLMVACTSAGIEPSPMISENEIEKESLSLPSTESVLPTPSQIDVSPDVGQDESFSLSTEGLCFVFISKRAEQLGGIPTSIENLYLAKDGTIQHSLETSDDYIFKLRQGTGNTLDIQQLLGLIEALSVNSQSSDSNDPGIIVKEYYESIVSIEMVDCVGSSRSIIFRLNEIPAEVEGILLTGGQLAETVPLLMLSRGQKFIRSQKLSSEKVVQLRDAGLVVDIDSLQLTSAPYIEEGITYERRLIPASSQKLYGSIPLSFKHGKSGHISIDQAVYQIRHLLIK